jgi:cellulose synthase/poly-beta-1,6-N-acetylglucosamine synthase-like glycosyltransferase
VHRISILMPCRDAAEHLEAAITSIREQTYTDYEVVAVDDGSVDDTFDMLRAWAVEDPRVRVVSTEPRGLVAALATGLAAARCELVARMDADDIAEPARLRKQVDLMDHDPRIAACGTGVRYFPPEAVRDGARRYERWINGLVTHQDIVRDIFVECPIPHPSLLIRRHVLHAIGGYRELGWPEDYDLVLRLWTAGYRMAKVPEPLLRWRESPERASRTDERYAEIEFRRIKIFFLRRTLLAGDRTAIVWGAGPVGKTFARELAEAGTPVVAFVDVDPGKIGQTIHGAPVVAPADVRSLLAGHGPVRVDPSPSPLILAAVGQAGAREEIRGECRRQGLIELDDFVAVA